MDEVELTMGRTLSIWWSFMWRAMLASILVGTVVGLIGGAGKPGVLTALFMLPVGTALNLWAMKAALGKQHGGCRVAFVENTRRRGSARRK